MLSTIYLPNGARITIHVPWTQHITEGGHIDYFTHPDKDYFATITSSGVVHISNEKKYATYYQPGEEIKEEPAGEMRNMFISKTKTPVTKNKRRTAATI